MAAIVVAYVGVPKALAAVKDWWSKGRQIPHDAQGRLRRRKRAQPARCAGGDAQGTRRAAGRAACAGARRACGLIPCASTPTRCGGCGRARRRAWSTPSPSARPRCFAPAGSPRRSASRTLLAADQPRERRRHHHAREPQLIPARRYCGGVAAPVHAGERGRTTSTMRGRWRDKVYNGRMGNRPRLRRRATSIAAAGCCSSLGA